MLRGYLTDLALRPEALERGDQVTQFALDLGFTGDCFTYVRAQALTQATAQTMERDSKDRVRRVSDSGVSPRV